MPKTSSKSAKKAPAKKSAKKAPVSTRKSKVTALEKMPTPKALEKMKKNDDGYTLASQDAVKFLTSRKQAVYNIARIFHLDPDELFQEGYEVLLTCLRDYCPVYEKKTGEFISVKFTTFFGNRMEGRGMEMRNRNPEYQARQAHLSDMTDEEKASFRENPPLLVQHLDQETTMQEALRGEVSSAREDMVMDANMKVLRDSFFEKKLNELVAKERDDKKRAALMHVKVGGVYNFQEVAYHFGVTDSRASQILNELMDAFYIQRMIDGDLPSVAYDFKKLKFNEKRALRLINDALTNSSPERAQKIIDTFKDAYTGALTAPPQNEALVENKTPEKVEKTPVSVLSLQPFEDVFTEEENQIFPLLTVDVRPVTGLRVVHVPFRQGTDNPETELPHIAAIMDADVSRYPLIVNESGTIIDGVRRFYAARQRGESELLCMTRQIPKELDSKVMRVSLNTRYKKPDKTELYYAISALLDVGLSQQKVADALGTSRTNVIVYAKVKEKASAHIRTLFEDGLIQITNASTCSELTERMQERVANFIRKYGSSWSKGSNFNDLYTAAAEGKLDRLEKKIAPRYADVAPAPQPAAAENMPVAVQQTQAVEMLNKRLNTYEQALRDAEIWTAQRESVITRQTQELTESRAEVESLKREMEAMELTKYGDPAALEEIFKQTRAYYSFSERLAGAAHAIEKASKQARSLELQRKQVLDVSELIDKLEKHVNALRVELLQRGRVSEKSSRRVTSATDASPKV